MKKGGLSMKIDHVGVVVPNLEDALKEYAKIGYTDRSEIVEIPHRGIRVVFINSLGPVIGSDIELIQIVKDNIHLAPTHIAFSGFRREERNYIHTLACKLIQEGKAKWEPIPELNVKVLFFTGPGGECLELVEHESASY
jgi:hypothetical protein